MSSDLYSTLAWLVGAPTDFKRQCDALSTATGSLGQRIRQLASYNLDEGQLFRLSRTIAKLTARGADLSPLAPFKLGIVSNGNVDLIVPTLAASAARHGVLLECVRAQFGQVIQEAIDPDSNINSAKTDAVLLCIDYRALPGMGSSSAVTDAMSLLTTLRQQFRHHSGAFSIVQTFAPPAESTFGSLDRTVGRSRRGTIDAINRELVGNLLHSGDVMLDVCALAEVVGLGAWHSPEQWNLAKLPFSSSFAPLYADHLGRLLGAMKGKARRCLILDLDNTVWGGVVGDDGLEGIQIAQGDSVGEAFLDVQRMALMLRERGVVVAVSSKNNDAIAREPFRRHPEMLLREKHIAVFQANWQDKAANITAIAAQLSLGLESMVFVDDNPAERGLVRNLLPDVAVPELGVDPALYARIVLAAGYFEAVSFSEEDAARADFYQDNAKRVALQSQSGDLDAYLASLGMEITFGAFDRTGRARIGQLIAKSNQFNLTTRRYSESEVALLETDQSVFTLQVRLTDIFGDNGMISVLVCRMSDPRTWEIDTWLMSCRVLGRRVEEMVLREVVLRAREHGVARIVGIYIPSGRNALVSDHYHKLGFTQIGANEEGKTHWELSTAVDIRETPMTVRYATHTAA